MSRFSGEPVRDASPELDLARLSELAEAATPGPWRAGYKDGSGMGSITAPDKRRGVLMDERPVIRGGQDGWGVNLGVDDPADAAFIAAFDPTTAKALLSEVAVLRTALRDVYVLLPPDRISLLRQTTHDLMAADLVATEPAEREAE